jgi:acylphosphatase
VAVVHLEITGRVQGVGFRWYIREHARQSGLAGWVRNRADGAVEVAAAGTVELLDALTRAARHGPPGAHVADVRALATESLSDLPHPFTVLR